MKAMVLAAGLGTRLRPLTENTPKALLMVNGRPLIEYSLLLLQKHGVRDVVINLHYLGDLIQKELGSGSQFGMKIHYSWEPHILGTGGGIKKASHYFEGEGFLVLNSDVLIDLDLKSFHRFHKRKKSLATMVVRDQDGECGFTPVWLGRGERIAGIGQRPEKPAALQPFMYTGVQYIEPDFLNFLPEDREACLIREGYLPAIGAKKRISGYRYDGYWNDLGTPDRYRQAERDLESGKAALSFLAV